VNRLKRELPTIETIRLTVTKISPPINGDVDNVAITIDEF
jgi:dihydroneopterin aldolase